MANTNVASVTNWFDYWTDPGTVAIAATFILLIPFIMLLFTPVSVSQLIVSMYTSYAGAVVALVSGHSVTDFFKCRAVSQEGTQQP